MPPTWFFILLAICAPFAIFAAIRAYRGEMRIWGEQVTRPTVVLAALIIAAAWSIFAAIQLGFIPNHAP